jgi:hypothetical protein
MRLLTSGAGIRARLAVDSARNAPMHKWGLYGARLALGNARNAPMYQWDW